MPLSELTPPWRAPRLRLIVNGEIIAGVTDAEVVTNNFYAADRFRATIALGADIQAAAPFWAGQTDILLEVQFSLDGGSSFTSMIQGVVDRVSIEATLGFVHLDGRDHAASLIEARMQETFANRTSSEIASILAGRHNLAARVAPTATPVGRYYESEHDRITLNQFSRATTEWDLLVFLAQHESFDVFVEGQTLYFQPTEQGPDQGVVLRREDLIDLRLERSLTLARDIEVIIKSWNSRRNGAFVQRARAAGSGNSLRRNEPAQRYVFVQPNLTPEEALKLAQRKLVELTRHERTVRMSMPGELTLTPRSRIVLEGTGTDFDQTYYVDVIERRLNVNEGLTQHILARNTSPRAMSTMSGNAVGCDAA